MIVYDVTDLDSFESVKNWMIEVDRLANDTVCKIIIGNKCDKEGERKVTFEQGVELGKHYGIPFLETSAKNAYKVEDVFSTVTKCIHDKQAKVQPVQSSFKGKLKKGSAIEVEAKAGCC